MPSDASGEKNVQINDLVVCATQEYSMWYMNMYQDKGRPQPPRSDDIES